MKRKSEKVTLNRKQREGLKARKIHQKYPRPKAEKLILSLKKRGLYYFDPDFEGDEEDWTILWIHCLSPCWWVFFSFFIALEIFGKSCSLCQSCHPVFSKVWYGFILNIFTSWHLKLPIVFLLRAFTSCHCNAGNLLLCWLRWQNADRWHHSWIHRSCHSGCQQRSFGRQPDQWAVGSRAHTGDSCCYWSWGEGSFGMSEWRSWKDQDKNKQRWEDRKGWTCNFGRDPCL